MTQFARPRVVVSKCLGFAPCRWNGATMPDDHVDALRPFVDFVPVCPEVEIGLGVPRDPIRVIESGGGLRLVQPATGRDVADEMRRFSDSYLGGLRDVDGFVLKSRSPSCGIKDTKVYPGVGKVASIRTAPGFFGEAVLRMFPGLAVEDEGRLMNERIWDHFLKKLFTTARFRTTAQDGDMKDLIGFHSDNKMLLMSYNQSQMRLMGRLVANREGRPFKDLADEYRTHLGLAMAKISRPPSNINTVLHMLGHSSKSLTKAERSYFLDAVEKYREDVIPVAVLTGLLKSWAIRFDQEYLLGQTFLDPYPPGLAGAVKKGQARDLAP